MHYLPAVSSLLPLAFALVLIAFSRCGHIVLKSIAGIGAVLTFLASSLMIPAMYSGTILGEGMSGPGLTLLSFFRADGLGIFFAVIFTFCFLMSTIYSFGYMAHSHAIARYYALLLAVEGAMMGVVMAASLLGVFLFFELMAVVSYLLVIHEEDETAMFAGAKYLYMTIVAGLAVFFGLVVTYFLSGRLDFLPGGYVQLSPYVPYALFAFLLGFGLKAGMFPMHIWLPDAHPAAPAPVSALLSGCMIKTGAYGIIRVIHYVYSPELLRAVAFDRLLLWLAVVTIMLGSALALRQDHLKRRLAYSSVAQIGYILLGIALLSERALFGALFHIFSHALMKSVLFLCAGAIIIQTGKKYVSNLAGIGHQMPVVMVSFALASVTMVGIPPFNAFISKWHLAVASLENGAPLLVAVLIISSLLNAFYYFPIVIDAFFVESDKGVKTGWIREEIPAGMLFPIILMALLCVGFAFIQPHWPVVFASRIASSIL